MLLIFAGLNYRDFRDLKKAKLKAHEKGNAKINDAKSSSLYRQTNFI